MAEQAREAASSVPPEHLVIGCNREVRDLSEQLIGSPRYRVDECEIMGQPPANVRSAFLTASVADLTLGPQSLLRMPGQYCEIPWPLYAVRNIENLEPVVLGASQVPILRGNQRDWVSAVYVRFCWKDDTSGEVRETIKIEAFESRPDALPTLSGLVDFRRDEEEDYVLWREQSRQARSEEEAKHFLDILKILYGPDRLFDGTL